MLSCCCKCLQEQLAPLGPGHALPALPASSCCQHQHLCSCKVKWIREWIQLNTNPGKEGGVKKKLIFSWICCPGWLCLQPRGTRAHARRGCGGRKEQRGQEQGWVYGSAGYTAWGAFVRLWPRVNVLLWLCPMQQRWQNHEAAFCTIWGREGSGGVHTGMWLWWGDKRGLARNGVPTHHIRIY